MFRPTLSTTKRTKRNQNEYQDDIGILTLTYLATPKLKQATTIVFEIHILTFLIFLSHTYICHLSTPNFPPSDVVWFDLNQIFGSECIKLYVSATQKVYKKTVFDIAK